MMQMDCLGKRELLLEQGGQGCGENSLNSCPAVGNGGGAVAPT